MSATGRGVHIDVPLSNVAIAYRPAGMIADLLAPVVPVNKQSDGFYIWQIADAYRIVDDKRAPATEANKLDRNMSSDTYFAKNYALADYIPDEDVENADARYLFTERSNRIEYISDRLNLNKEYRLALKCTSGSNVGSYSAIASAWTDYTNSDPRLDIETAIANVEDATGQRPNRMIFGNKVWRHFRRHDDIINGVYGNQTAGKGRIVNTQAVANLFEMDQVLVGAAYYNTAGRNQDASLSPLWGDHVLIYYAPMQASKQKPSFMYSFRWNKVMAMQARVSHDDDRHAEKIELGYYQDEKIVSSALGFLLLNCTSST